MKNSVITNVKVENPYYLYDGFRIIVERLDYKRGIKVVNIYDNVTESSIRRLRLMFPRPIVKLEKWL